MPDQTKFAPKQPDPGNIWSGQFLRPTGIDQNFNRKVVKSFDLELATRQGRPSFQIAQVPSPPQKGERRSTNGFSSEKFTKVLNGHV